MPTLFSGQRNYGISGNVK